MLTITGYILISIGVVFLFLGALGIFRMPDIYTRLQAGTKATTLGALGTILGVGMVHPEWFWKTLIIAMFIAISNPISSHALARGSYKVGHKPFMKDDSIDSYSEVSIDEGEEF
ncbi:MAG: monovalent cation/H(+) antiporter subunit G [Ignavibacteriae bacterium]|nr:monovalent cation/H(+) antiporter subunit G [Ignavibacteriota bacterium]